MTNYMNKYKQPSGGSLVLPAVVAVLTVLVIITVVMVVRLTGEVRELAGGEPAVSAMAGMGENGDMLLLQDGSLGEIWLPVLNGVEVSPYDQALFQKDENGFMEYGDENVQVWRGIDVSFYQGDIDWQAVKASGVDFAIVRLGYRGYKVGNIMLDECFEQNMEGALDAGLDVGVYFFSQATTEEEAREEAELVLDCIKPYKILYPVVFDWEVIPGNAGRNSEVSVQRLGECAKVFCDTIDEAGYIPMVYANKRLALLKYDLRQLTDYDLWLANFANKPDFYYDYEMWQYSERGTVDGIVGNVDLNISFVNYAER
ncbi:MAG: glycoside hydrolase family 25 protein [Syntrophomonadaceae bacterium]|nr:glycoside hydrolase family 25 protein [Syntrophomonadaceae bacterium]